MNSTIFSFRAAFRPRLAVGALLASLFLLASGCASYKYSYGVSERFSMNIAPPPGWLTDPKAPLLPAEKEVIQRRGVPDFVRYWWRPDGSLVTSSDFAGRRDAFQELVNAVKKSWIYLKEDKAEEVVFLRGGGSYSVRPLAEPLKLICQYGDPSSRVAPFTVEGEKHEVWMWIEHGLQIEMVDGKVKTTKNFQGTGAGTILLK